MDNERSLAKEITEGFEALKSMRNNEPVAFVDNVWINRPDLAIDLGIGQMFSRCQLSDHQIPLYNHPVKELTDAITLLEKYADKLEDERPNKGLSDVVLDCVEILRKAQEK